MNDAVNNLVIHETIDNTDISTINDKMPKYIISKRIFNDNNEELAVWFCLYADIHDYKANYLHNIINLFLTN